MNAGVARAAGEDRGHGLQVTPTGYTACMCIICVDLARQAMTAKEGQRALGEMRGKLDAAHIAEVEAKLAEAEKAAKSKP